MVEPFGARVQKFASASPVSLRMSGNMSGNAPSEKVALNITAVLYHKKLFIKLPPPIM